MVLINEWLPNPTGADKGAEWVELFNNGNSNVSLNGWSLVGGNGKKFYLNGKNIGAGQYFVLNAGDAKLTLRNTDESLSLYDASGKIVSQSSFLGSAPEGKSYSFIGDDSMFVFSDPTPGAANKITAAIFSGESYPADGTADNSISYLDVAGLALFIGLIYPFLIIAIFKKNDYFSKLFFGRD